jgi:hypothetical protein
VETGELLQQEGSKDLMERLLNLAYRFRSLCPFQGELGISFNEEFYRPRNYTDLTVDTVRIQNTLRFGIQVRQRTSRRCTYTSFSEEVTSLLCLS